MLRAIYKTVLLTIAMYYLSFKNIRLPLLKVLISSLLICCSGMDCCAQNEASKEKSFKYIGISIGRASQRTFPFTADEYVYASTSYKFQYNQKLWDWSSWDAHLLIEPSYFKVDHQLLNLFFITPQDDNFQERRERFLQPRTFNEYALNIGLRVSRVIYKNIEVFGLLSSGPMYADQSTERLKGGFAFSNVMAAGVQYQLSKNFKWEARLLIRHTSNAGLQWPNSGHNSAGGETGLIYIMD